MGENYERLTAGDSDYDGGANNSPYPYGDLFDSLFPYYLSIGMTYEQFWEGDPSLCRAYRRAADYKTERRNTELWLQGLYVYDALVVSIGNAFAKKGSTKQEYLKEPIPITEREKEQREKERLRKERADYEAMLEQMKDFARKFNASRKAKEEQKNGRSNS